MAGNLVNAVELLQSLRYTIHLHKEKSPSFNSQHKTIVGKNRNVKKKLKDGGSVTENPQAPGGDNTYVISGGEEFESQFTAYLSCILKRYATIDLTHITYS